MSYHAKLSPSSAKRWTDCTASIGAQAGLSDDGSEAARLGTTCHQLSAECLAEHLDPQTYLGRVLHFWVRAEDEATGEHWGDEPEWERMPITLAVTKHRVVVTQDMIDACTNYINFVQEQVSLSGAALYVEQRVPIGHITGEYDGDKPAGGTSDVVMVAAPVLTTIDAKFGRAKVLAYDVIKPAGVDIISGEVTAAQLRINLQLAFYLLGSLEKYCHRDAGTEKYYANGSGDRITKVKAIIVQPYLSHTSEYSCELDELLEVADWLQQRAEATRTEPVFAPSQDNCHFCKARMTCESRTSVVLSTALVGFDDIDEAQPRSVPVNALGSVYDTLGMIRQWCNDIETRVYDELTVGNKVMRNDGLQYKLVVGKKGNRTFDDPEAVAKLLKSMRVKDELMYTRKLITAAQAEDLSKPTKKGKTIIAPPVLGETQWARVVARITQSAGSPTVALETDPRPAIEKSTVDFEDVPQADDFSDLF